MKLIPDILRIYVAAEETVTVDGDTSIQHKVNPAFVTASDNPVTNKTAQNWVESMNRGWDHVSKKETIKAPTVTLEVPNKSFHQPQIFELEQRGNGGRAYKVAIPMEGVSSGKIYVDFRESELLDAIQNVGILPGGKLNGDYIFGSVGSQMKLFRIGSETHKKTIENDTRKVLKVIPMTKLIPGHRYEMASGTSHVYLGKFAITYKSIAYDDKVDSYRYYQPEIIVKTDEPIKEHLFVEFYDGKIDICYYSFETKKSSSYVIDHGLLPEYLNIDVSKAAYPEDKNGFKNRCYVGSKLIYKVEPLK